MANISFLFKKESLLQSTGIVLIFSGLQRAIDMIRSIVFARTLGPESYGTFTLAFLFLSIIIPLACLGLPSCYTRYTPQYEKKGMVISFFKKTVKVSLVSAIIIMVLAFLFSASFSQMIYGESRFYYLILIASLAIVPNTLFESLQAFFGGLRVFKFYSLLDFSHRTLFTIFGITLLFLWKASPEAPLLGFVLGMTASIILFGYLLKREVATWSQQKIMISEGGFYKKMLKFSLWFTVTPIVFILFHYTDRLMLNRFLGLYEVGLYSVAVSLAQVLLFLGMVISSTLGPYVSNMWEHQEKTSVMFYLNLASKVTVLLSLGIAMLITIFKTPILSLLYGKEYLGASQLIPILLILSIVNSVWWMMGHYVKLIERTYVYFLVGIIGLVANVFLNIMLIDIYGLIGAAIASTLSFFIILSITLVFNLKYRFVVDLRTLLILGFTLILLLPPKLIILAAGALVIICFKTSFILSYYEKTLIAKKISLMYSGSQRYFKDIVPRVEP
ncbi:MAG: hypothetical protein AMJ45_00335 [Syntrophobacter sp. DG_60]|nr:MAG: hypothetical protein AMJ45_00335 [Syntrophobacter sp. DG_60]